MNRKVVYFTRSGTSKRVAEKIAAKLDCPLVQITDGKNWGGLFGYIRAGYYASRSKSVAITLSAQIGETDELVVVSPLWAGTIAPAVQAFAGTVRADRMHLVVTSLGSTIKNRAPFKSVNDIVKKNHDEDRVIAILLNRVDQAAWPLGDTFC